MSTANIREYARLAGVYPGGSAPIAQEPGYDQPALTFSTHAESAAFRLDTYYIGVVTDAAYRYVVSKAGTAATSAALPIPANELIYIGVSPGYFISIVAA